MYDEFSADYDRFVNWAARLATELPFIHRELQNVGARRVLDAGCGTGVHALALARMGYEATGTDLSAGMIQRARANAAETGVEARFEIAGFGELHARLGGGYDAILCLGSSLAHLLTPDELAAALSDFAACLRPGGLLLLQNRNHDLVWARRERWMEPQSYRADDAEWIFQRFYDFGEDGALVLNMVTLKREGTGPWRQHVAQVPLRSLFQADLLAALEAAGFGENVCWGDMQGTPFDIAHSHDLVTTSKRVGE